MISVVSIVKLVGMAFMTYVLINIYLQLELLVELVGGTQ